MTGSRSMGGKEGAIHVPLEDEKGRGGNREGGRGLVLTLDRKGGKIPLSFGKGSVGHPMFNV